MRSRNLAFVTMERRDNSFAAFLALEDLLLIVSDPEPTLQRAAELYEHAIVTMRSLIAEMQSYKAHRKPIPARIMWKLGDAIFQLKEELEALFLQLNGTYEHLARDLGVKREWLKKPVIFRRYLPKEDLIPESLSWRRCRDTVRKTAERLCKGLSLD